MMKRVSLSIAAAFVAGSIGHPLYAQTTDDDSSDMIKLEELVVTARKKEEVLMDLPLSVSIVDDQLIEAASLISIDDIARVTPGFKTNSAFGRQADRPVVRGVSGISTAVELAGYFVDGVYVSGTLQTFDLDSIERVEVLKGPQSAAFGRRTFAGAVNYITKVPTEESENRIKAEFGSNGHRVLGVTLAGKSGIWGYRANIRDYSYDGDFENTLDIGPDDIGGEQTTSFNGTLYITPSEATNIRVNLVYAEDDDEQYAIALQGSDQNNCSFTDANGSVREYYCGELRGDTPVSLGGFLEDDQYGVKQDRLRSFVQVDHDFGSVNLTSITAYNSNDYYAGQDQSFAGLQTAFSFDTFGQVPASDWHTIDESESSNFSQELWLRGTAANDQLNWSAGVYYYDEESNGLEAGSFENDIQNSAVMGGLEYAFSDQFTAGLELRYAEDDISQKPSGSTTVFEETFDSLTHRLSASYFPVDGTLIYANWSTGTLPGSFNTNTALPEDLIAVDEGELEQFELGLKSRVADNLEITASIYTQEWTDQVRSQFIVIDGLPQNYQANQGTTDFTGFELSANWYATERLTVTVAGTYNKSEVNDFISDDATDIAITGDGDVSGAQLPLSPESEAYASLTYDLPLANNYNLVARVDWSYQDERFVRLTNEAIIGAASTVNANLTLDSNDRWKISLWGKNLTDEDAPVSAIRYIEADSFFFGGRAFAITPRRGTEFGITGTFDF